MLKFGVIAEGVCDQAVLEKILLGYFQGEADEPIINPIQPPPAPPGGPPSHGGWTLVFKSIAIGDPQQALQFNDYLIIQIDADVQEDKGFNVPKRENGNQLAVAERIARIRQKLEGGMDEVFLQSNAHRILFAIAVDAIECWLLPLLYTDSKAGKTVGCLPAANSALRKGDQKGLSAGDDKFLHAYEELSSRYLKRKDLLGRGLKNPSLKIFVEQLDRSFPDRAEGTGPQ